MNHDTLESLRAEVDASEEGFNKGLDKGAATLALNFRPAGKIESPVDLVAWARGARSALVCVKDDEVKF